jgi:hypothetical protein
MTTYIEKLVALGAPTRKYQTDDPLRALATEPQLATLVAAEVADKDVRIAELEETCAYDGEILRKIGYLLRYVDGTQYSGTYDVGVKVIIDERDQLRAQVAELERKLATTEDDAHRLKLAYVARIDEQRHPRATPAPTRHQPDTKDQS